MAAQVQGVRPPSSTCVLLDTSASMNQRTKDNLSLLDVAKAAIEHMVRRFQNERQHKFLLVTTRGGGTVESGWADSQTMFLQKVKNVVARDLSDLPAALACCFDLLERGRGMGDIDNYAQGRQPCLVHDAASVWVLTDGCDISNESGVLAPSGSGALALPPSQAATSRELFLEGYRWDQRVWMTVLRCPGMEVNKRDSQRQQDPVHSLGPSALICDATGGKAQAVTQMRQLMQAVESLSARLVSSSVAVRLEPLELQGDGSAATHQACTALVRPVRLAGEHGWPIPEPFMLSDASPGLPRRPSVPVVHFRAALLPDASDPFDTLTPDVYEVEECAATALLRAEARANPRFCLQLLARGSNSSPGTANPAPLGEPFGLLRFANGGGPGLGGGGAGGVAQLLLMPYNFPKLLDIVSELRRPKQAGGGAAARSELEAYVRAIPAYYVKAVRTLVRRVSPTVPERADRAVPQGLAHHLERIREAKRKADSEREFTWWGNSGAGAEGAGEDAGPAVLSRVSSSSSVASVASASSSASMDFYWTMRGVDPQGLEAGLAGLSTAVQQQHGAPARSGGGCYRNAADIPREALVVQLRRMRFALLGQQAGAVDKRQEARYDALSHSVPIAEMGNFHEVLRRREAEGASPLRDPHLDKDDEERRRRMQFGNPFRKAGDKHIMLSDEIEAGEASAGSKQRDRRRRGRRAMARRPSAAAADLSLSESDSSCDVRPGEGGAGAGGTGHGGDAAGEDSGDPVLPASRWELKLSLLRLVRCKGPQAKALLLRRAARLQDDTALVAAAAEHARQHRRADLARLLDAIVALPGP